MTPTVRRILITVIILSLFILAGVTSCKTTTLIVTDVQVSRTVTIDKQQTYAVWANNKLYLHTTKLYKVGDTIKN